MRCFVHPGMDGHAQLLRTRPACTVVHQPRMPYNTVLCGHDNALAHPAVVWSSALSLAARAES
eukprot:2470218-Karenia_brevis.AAC.1